MIFKILRAVSSIALILFSSSCRSMSSTIAGSDLNVYRIALHRTDPSKLVQPDTATVQRFVDFYRTYSASNIEEQFDSIYAKNAYLRDPFYEIEGSKALKQYFLCATEPILECTFGIQHIAADHGEYYYRWIRRLQLKQDKTLPATATLGASHIRFNREGKVVFHVDYWDPSIPVYDRIALLGRFVRFVKNRI